MKTRKTNAYKWLLEPLEQAPGYMERKMFGCLAAYAHARLVAVLADREAPWDGLLVPTQREHHESLIQGFPALRQHPVLGKWLYLSSSHPQFEETAVEIIEKCTDNDPRLGVEPKQKRSKRGGKNAGKKRGKKST